jgi:transposase
MPDKRTYRKLRVQLSESDRQQVQTLLRTGYESARVLRRVTVLSLLDKGESASRISALLEVSPTTVRSIGRRYNEGGLDMAIYDHMGAEGSEDAKERVSGLQQRLV